MKRSLALISIIAACTACISGCNSNEAGSEISEALKEEGSFFDFSTPTGVYPTGSVTVALNSDLIPLLEADKTSVAVKSLTLSSVEVKSTQLCAIKGAIEYNDGWEEAAKPSGSLISERSEPTSYYDLHPSDYWVRQFLYPHLDEGARFIPISQFNADNPEWGMYIDDSANEFIHVTKCNLSPADDDYYAGFDFKGSAPLSDSSKESTKFPLRIAEVEFGSMKDGTIFIPESELSSYAQDSHGTWVHK
ncbi:hypothetical protein [Trueperella sp. LYQ141]|uniref:hypothetical protein n=1 Tax=Trueperella sp. LYQ141 TaxID=3391058 RepID=UPI003982EDFF